MLASASMSCTRRFLYLAAFHLLLSSTNSILRAQVAGATLSGTVTDSTGAVVARVEVSITNRANGSIRKLSTDEAGFYSAPNLLPGSYDATASAANFSTTKIDDITLTVGEKKVLNVTLEVGNVGQTVLVDEKAPQIELGSSAVSAEVNAATIRELPLNGRDWVSLATLQPGVASVRTHPVQATRGLGNAADNFGQQAEPKQLPFGWRPHE